MKKTDYIKKTTLVLIMLLSINCLFTSIVKADNGPKPSLEIIVRGMDTDDYWLDLLVTDESEYCRLEISKEERASVSKLAEYEDDDGFHPALLVGTRVPLYGKLKGVKREDGSFVHEFSYVGVPKRFKIAILKSDGSLIVSKVVKRTRFQSVMEYNLEDSSINEPFALAEGEVTEKIPWTRIVTGIFLRLIVTLIIEIFIAVLFGFTLKKSLKILLITNISTQILLNVIVFSSNINGPFGQRFAFVKGEFYVMIIELIVYTKLLKEKGKGRRAAYAVFANLLSLISGLFLVFIP